MSRNHFFIPEAKSLTAEMDLVARSRSSRGTVFYDFLKMCASALCFGTDEPAYLEVVKRYADGEEGGVKTVDRIARWLGVLLNWTADNPYGDLLGDVFQGGVTFGENGQFFTPESVCRLMAEMSVGDMPVVPGQVLRICDPACGSGRTLLAVAAKRPGDWFCGIDLDERCALMTAINLNINGLAGAVVHGNTLSLETFGGWAVGYPVPGQMRRLDAATARRFLVMAKTDPVVESVPLPDPEPATETPAKIKRKCKPKPPSLFDGIGEDGDGTQAEVQD